MKLDKLTEATMLALRGKLSEVKGSSKTYTCIEDRQHGDFCVGATMTAEEWGETAMGWADSDGWTDPAEPLLKNFKTEQDCINFIDDMWEITIVPSDSPEAKEFLGKKQEARSHKEDNENKNETRSKKLEGETENSELVIAKVFKNEDEAEKFIKENHIWTCNKHNFGIKGFVVIYDPSRSENKINYTSEIAEKERQDWLRKNGIK